MKYLTLLLTLVSLVACSGNAPTPPGPSGGQTTLLTYRVMAHPAAVASPSTTSLNTTSLIVTASYQGPGSIPIGAISIGISVGSGEHQLVPSQQAADIDWKFNPHWIPCQPGPHEPSDGYVTFNLVPADSKNCVGTQIFGNGDTFTFTFENVKVNTKTGPANIQITEYGASAASTIKTISKLPQGSPLPNFSFSAEPLVVPPNEKKIYLSWSGPDAATYDLEYYTPQGSTIKKSFKNGKGTYPSTGDPGLAIEQDTFFYMTATDKKNSVTQFLPVTVEIPGPEITEFTGTFISEDGIDKLQLSWKVKNALYCEITGDADKLQLNVDDYTLFPSAANPLKTTYTLTAVANEEYIDNKEQTLVVVWGKNAPGSPLRIGDAPTDIAVSPDAPRIYVTDQGAGTILVLDSKTLDPVAGSPVHLGLNPLAALSRDGRSLFVAHTTGPNSDKGSLSVLNATTLERSRGPIGLDQVPQAITATPDGKTILVETNPPEDGGGKVYALDAATLDPVAGSPVQLENNSEGLAVAPDGSRAYVASQDSEALVALDIKPHQVAWGRAIQIGSSPNAVAVTPDGNRIFAASFSDEILSILDSKSMQPVSGSPLTGFFPTDVSFSPDGARTFVTNLISKEMWVLDTETLQVLAKVPVGTSPLGVTASPDGARVFVSSSIDGSISILIPSELSAVSFQD